MHKAFEYGTWGGEIRRGFEPRPGEIVALEHWGSSGSTVAAAAPITGASVTVVLGPDVADDDTSVSAPPCAGGAISA